MKTCPKCETEDQKSSRFCKKCGVKDRRSSWSPTIRKIQLILPEPSVSGTEGWTAFRSHDGEEEIYGRSI